MCSQAGDCECFNETVVKNKNRLLHCIKCNGPPAVVIRSDDPALCKSCFIDGCVHKLNSAFGKNRSLRGFPNVAVAFSGGLNSLALLHLLKESFTISQTSKMRFKPKIFYLEDLTCSPSTFNEITQALKDSCLEYYVLKYEKDELLDTLYKYIGSDRTQKNLTTLQSLVKWIRILKLCHCAIYLKCSYLMVGSSGHRVSTNFLTGLLEGRGSNSSFESAFVDKRRKVTILKPLNEFLGKEIAFFVRLYGLKPITPPNIFTPIFMQNSNANSLERITQDFIAGLQNSGFPSTVRTVLSISSKLAQENEDKNSEELNQCILCTDTIQSPQSGINTLAAASLQHSLSLGNPCKGDNSKDDDIKRCLCPSCLIMYNELPEEIRSKLEQWINEFRTSPPDLICL